MAMVPPPAGASAASAFSRTLRTTTSSASGSLSTCSSGAMLASRCRPAPGARAPRAARTTRATAPASCRGSDLKSTRPRSRRALSRICVTMSSMRARSASMRSMSTLRLLRRRRAQRQRLERELQARERGLELMATPARGSCPAPPARAPRRAARARSPRCRARVRAGRTRPPRRTGAVRLRSSFAQRLRRPAGASAAAPSVTVICGSSCSHRAAAGAGIEQRLRGAQPVRRRRCARRCTFSTRVVALVEEPPADLHDRHQHQRERGELEDARLAFMPCAARVLAQRLREAAAGPRCVWASDRKQAS